MNKSLQDQLKFIHDTVEPFADFPVQVSHDGQYFTVTTTIRGDVAVSFKYPDVEYTPVEITRLTRGRLLALKTVE